MAKVSVSIRLDPKLKATADAIAAREHRTFTNLIETLIQDRQDAYDVQRPLRARPELRAR